MFFNRMFIACMLCLFLQYADAQTPEGKAQLKKDVSFLSANKMKGRLAGTGQEIAAAKYIAKRFEEIGCVPLGDNGTYFQDFTFKLPDSLAKLENSKKTNQLKTARNVIAYIDNKGRNTIVIGAHYDHIGYGLMGERYNGKRIVHNGADDNASGTAAMLMLAKRLMSKKDAANNYIFIAFSAEEQGMFGSKYFVDHSETSLSKLNCMINFDMIGRLNDDSVLIVTGTGTSPKWKSILKKVHIDDTKIEEDESGLGRSDHSSFYLKEIPVLNFFTGKHEDYHKPTDDAESIDIDGVAKIIVFADNILSEIDKVLKLAYTKTEDPALEEKWSSVQKDQPKYVVTLGVMPDYSYSGNGMRIDATIENRPASRAGMQGGDIVKKLGNIEVKDMNSYMDALGKFSKGDKTVVQFDRNGSLIELELEF